MMKVKAAFSNSLKTAYAGLIILMLWYILHWAVGSHVIPSPYKTIMNFIEIFPGTLSLHLLASLLRISSAILFSLFAGSITGLLIGMNKRADAIFSPIVYILYPLPKIAFLPILMMLFGLGDTPKIVLIIIIIVFQIILAARDGVKEISRELLISVKSLGLSKADLYRHLIIPAVLPKIITSLRICIGVSISVLFFGENFATSYGIGYFIMNSWLMVNYVEMFSGILALSLMGFLLFKLVDLLENTFCVWIKIGKKDV